MILLLFLPGVFHSITAQDKALLVNMGITHILNTADGPQHIDTGPSFYKDTNILYHGVQATDQRDFDLSPFFTESAEFIHRALIHNGTSPQTRHKDMRKTFQTARDSQCFCVLHTTYYILKYNVEGLKIDVMFSLTDTGKVLVHCARGISRSGALVLAFLMIKEKLSLVQAIKVVHKHRNILPNVGFLNQLCHLDSCLALKRRNTT